MEIFAMILKMTAVTLLYVIVSFFVWKRTKDKELTSAQKAVIGILYGMLSIFSTHFAIDFETMLLNVRDLGPMIAGMFFDPVSGIIAGMIGSIERYIVGTYFGIGEYTRVACSISTCLAGFLAAFMRVFIFKGKKPSIIYAFFMGAFIEVFHMYVVFITHRNDMLMAFYVVRTCSAPMIIFSGLGMAATAAVIKKSLGELRNPLAAVPREKVPVSQKFQAWLFGVTVAVLLLNFGLNYTVQSEAALQEAKIDLVSAARDISNSVTWLRERGGNIQKYTHYVGMTGSFAVIDAEGNHVSGTNPRAFNETLLAIIKEPNDREFFNANVYGEESLCYVLDIAGDFRLFVRIPMEEVYEARDIQAYETMLADILLFTVIYVLISMLVQGMVVDNLLKVNKSLGKITDGDLDERVDVYTSSEFASLSDDINLTVDVLKGYIDAAEKRIEQELLLAHNIQEAALPKNFKFAHTGFDIYATMDPAKEVGGDFYDFFFVDADKIALVIADVSGKGIPAALFMMRSKTAIRSLAEGGHEPGDVFERVNKELCEGNEINMFVTAWMGIVDLKTGVVKCVNAGHEYPSIQSGGGLFELVKDKHRPPLGTVEDLTYEEYEMRLEPGDCLFLYTDGVAEAVNVAYEQYGTERLLNILSANSGQPMTELLADVKADIENFVGEADQFDDITMMGFRYNGPR
ncbi:MAG: SpoIIE family protein phosphatase [Mogibacterium sp.]|nr:SpoIIE family protein phosphatase [Mogibacterium sp.]